MGNHFVLLYTSSSEEQINCLARVELRISHYRFHSSYFLYSWFLVCEPLLTTGSLQSSKHLQVAQKLLYLYRSKDTGFLGGVLITLHI